MAAMAVRGNIHLPPDFSELVFLHAIWAADPGVAGWSWTEKLLKFEDPNLKEGQLTIMGSWVLSKFNGAIQMVVIPILMRFFQGNSEVGDQKNTENKAMFTKSPKESVHPPSSVLWILKCHQSPSWWKSQQVWQEIHLFYISGWHMLILNMS